MPDPQTYHILNGDALREKFPKKLIGRTIVFREVFISGPLSIDDLFEKRIQYFHESLKVKASEYKEKAQYELEKINLIPQESEINLWFEDDLFCQCNLWYACHQIILNKVSVKAFLIRPNTDHWSGFGGMDSKELESAFFERKNITLMQLEAFSKLWIAYVKNDLKTMQSLGKELETLIPRLSKVIQAHQERIETPEFEGKPKLLIKEIIKNLDTHDFGKIFKAFTQKAGIYGFGDTQVKSFYDQVVQDL